VIGADESMSNKRCSVIVKTVSDVSENLQVIVIRLGDYRLTCLWKVRDLSRVTPRSLTVSDRGAVDPATCWCEMLGRQRLR